jgi:hypothetical protein
MALDLDSDLSSHYYDMSKIDREFDDFDAAKSEYLEEYDLNDMIGRNDRTLMLNEMILAEVKRGDLTAARGLLWCLEDEASNDYAKGATR